MTEPYPLHRPYKLWELDGSNCLLITGMTYTELRAKASTFFGGDHQDQNAPLWDAVLTLDAETVWNWRHHHLAPYQWIILYDYLEHKAKAVTIEGPRTGSSVSGPTDWFRMFDADGKLCYKGCIRGKYTGFEPLEDYGMPNAGCTRIEYLNKETGNWEEL